MGARGWGRSSRRLPHAFGCRAIACNACDYRRVSVDVGEQQCEVDSVALCPGNSGQLVAGATQPPARAGREFRQRHAYHWRGGNALVAASATADKTQACADLRHGRQSRKIHRFTRLKWLISTAR